MSAPTSFHTHTKFLLHEHFSKEEEDLMDEYDRFHSSWDSRRIKKRSKTFFTAQIALATFLKSPSLHLWLLGHRTKRSKAKQVIEAMKSRKFAFEKRLRLPEILFEDWWSLSILWRGQDCKIIASSRWHLVSSSLCQTRTDQRSSETELGPCSIAVVLER